MSEKKILGLDLGITSVGWGIIDEKFNILDKGVRLFEESTADGNQNRRSFRGTRRLLRRKKARIIRMYKYLEEIGIIDDNFQYLDNPYDIRVKGLTEKLTSNELATALLHIVKRRGSSLEIVEDEADSNDALSAKSAIKNNLVELRNKKIYVAQIQLQRLQDETMSVRGHHNIFKTADYVEEAKIILKNQDISDERIKQIIKIIETRRVFTDGPGSVNAPSKYGRFRPVDLSLKDHMINSLRKTNPKELFKKEFVFEYENEQYKIFKNGTIIPLEPINMIDLMKGKCSVYPDEYRASKRSCSAELYNLLNELNNVRFVDSDRMISMSEKEQIMTYVIDKGNFTYANFKKMFNIKHDEEVTGFIQKNDKNIITGFTGFKKIHKVYSDLGEKLPTIDVIDSISDILSSYPTVEDRRNELAKSNIPASIIDQLVLLTQFSGTHALSYKAIKNFIPLLLEENLNQQQLRMKYEMTESSNINSIIFTDENITNPVVRRVQLEAQKLIKELISIHGPFDSIVVETTRDKNSKDKVSNIREIQKRNLRNKEDAQEIIESSGYSNDRRLSAQLSMKIRLYNEQNQRCAYTGEVIDIGKLIRDPKAYEIDHIIPYSISFDDSLNNKVLVTHRANQLKGNKTPFGYFSSGLNLQNEINNYETFKSFVQSNNNYNYIKKGNLLFEKDITKYNTQLEFKNRNLTDTSYAIRSFMMHLKKYFNQNEIKTNVFTIRGKQTALYRKVASNLWFKNNPNSSETENPFIKNREVYMHHAIDALICAGLYNQSSFRALYNLEVKADSGLLYNDQTAEIMNNNPLEDPVLYKFFNHLSTIEMSDVKYSWKIDNKPNRSISDQTIYSTRVIADQHVIVKKETIYDMKKDKAAKIFEDPKKIERILMYKHDPKTFEILQSAYKQYKHETYPFKVYKDNHGPIRKYSKKANSPVVTAIKYLENNLGNNMDISHKYNVTDKKVVKLQLSTYRIDVYYNNEQYKFITIRYNHIGYDSKLEKYVIKEDIYQNLLDEKGIDNTYSFMFSFVRNNIIEVSRKVKNSTETNKYRFITTNNDTENKIELKQIAFPGDARITVGISKNITNISKYNVSVSGKISKVNKEHLKFVI